MINDTEPIDGKLKVLRILGQGGGGTVYVCWHDVLEKEVAVKVLSEPFPDPVSLKRFRKEAQAISTCRHPGIVSLHSFGMCANGKPYYVMDLVNGKPLSSILAEKQALSPSEFEDIFLKVADALEHAHNNGIVHRDIKPSNIMVDTTDGATKAYVIDFGLSRSLNSTKLTAADSLLGTPTYMSPEQCTGAFVDQRSDIYSLGCTMYEAATGKPPFTGEAFEILMAHVNETPKDIPTRLAPLLNRCIAIAPEERFPNLAELKRYLHGLKLSSANDFWLPGTKGKPSPATKEKTKLNPKRNTRLILSLAIAATAVGILSIALLVMRQQPPVQNQVQTQALPTRKSLLAAEVNIGNALKEGKYQTAIELSDVAIQQAERLGVSRAEIGRLMAEKLQAMISARRPLAEIESYAKLTQEKNPTQLGVRADTYYYLAFAYEHESRPEQAARSFERAVELIRGPVESPDIRNLLYTNYIQHLQATNGPVEKQIALLKEGFEYFKALEDKRIPHVAIEERYLVELLSFYPNIAKTHPDLLRDMAAHLAKKAQRSKVWHEKLNWIVFRANIEALLGNQQLAKSLFAQALALSDKNEQKPRVNGAFVMHNWLSRINMSQHQRVVMAKQSLDMCANYTDDTVDSYLTSVVHVARMCHDDKQFDESIKYYLHAADIAEKAAYERLKLVTKQDKQLLFDRSLASLDAAAKVALEAGNTRQAEQCVERGETLLDSIKTLPTVVFNDRDSAYRGEFNQVRNVIQPSR